MPKIKVNDISMYYEVHGKGEPLVFVPGFGADHTTWSHITAKLSEHFQVILLDNRGSGQSDIPQAGYSIELMANDVAQLCQKLNLEKATFVGSSMGGFIAQSIAHQYPMLVKSLVISNSAMSSASCFRFYVAAQYELLKSGAPIESLIRACQSWMYSFNFLNQEGKISELLQLALSSPFPFTVIGYEGQQWALNSFDSTTWVKKITAKTLVIGAEQDIIFSPAMTASLAEAIPSAQYHCFKNCGHLPHIEIPHEFVSVLMDFVE